MFHVEHPVSQLKCLFGEKRPGIKPEKKREENGNRNSGWRIAPVSESIPCFLKHITKDKTLKQPSAATISRAVKGCDDK
jgi:hypothetical protein